MNRSYRAGLVTLASVCVIGVAGRIVSATADGIVGAQKAADIDGNKHDCVPLRLETTDYFVDVVSTLPNHLGVPAQIEVRRVRPSIRPGVAAVSCDLRFSYTDAPLTGSAPSTCLTRTIAS